jgi:hypothetical protein
MRPGQRGGGGADERVPPRPYLLEDALKAGRGGVVCGGALAGSAVALVREACSRYRRGIDPRGP